MTVKYYIDSLGFETEIINIEEAVGYESEMTESHLLSDKYLNCEIDTITTDGVNTLTPWTTIKLLPTKEN